MVMAVPARLLLPTGSPRKLILQVLTPARRQIDRLVSAGTQAAMAMDAIAAAAV